MDERSGAVDHGPHSLGPFGILMVITVLNKALLNDRRRLRRTNLTSLGGGGYGLFCFLE